MRFQSPLGTLKAKWEGSPRNRQTVAESVPRNGTVCALDRGLSSVLLLHRGKGSIRTFALGLGSPSLLGGTHHCPASTCKVSVAPLALLCFPHPQAFFDLEATNQELKSDLKDLFINSAQ